MINLSHLRLLAEFPFLHIHSKHLTFSSFAPPPNPGVSNRSLTLVPRFTLLVISCAKLTPFTSMMKSHPTHPTLHTYDNYSLLNTPTYKYIYGLYTTLHTILMVYFVYHHNKHHSPDTLPSSRTPVPFEMVTSEVVNNSHHSHSSHCCQHSLPRSTMTIHH